MARVKTFTNGGSLLPSDLDSIEDDYEVGFGTYKVLADVSMRLDAPSNLGLVYLDGYTGSGLVPGSAQGGMAALWLDPARYWGIAATSGVNPRTVYYNVGVSAITNHTAVGVVTFTTSLCPVTGALGSSGAGQVGITLGGLLAGSSVAITNPGADAVINGAWSGDFAAPAAGLYALGVVVSAATAAGSSIALRARLTMRQV